MFVKKDKINFITCTGDAKHRAEMFKRGTTCNGKDDSSNAR